MFVHIRSLQARLASDDGDENAEAANVAEAEAQRRESEAVPGQAEAECDDIAGQVL